MCSVKRVKQAVSDNKRKTISGAQKAKVALEVIKGLRTINQIAQEHGVHPTQVKQWKKELLANAGDVFEMMEPHEFGHSPLWQDSCHYLKFNQLGR